MNNLLKSGLLTAALAGAVGAGVAMQAEETHADDSKVKCYGVAKAGQNDCGAADGSHSCAGHATEDNDPNEWKFTSEEECHEVGGSTTPGHDEHHDEEH